MRRISIAPANTAPGKEPGPEKASGNGRLNGGHHGSSTRSTARRDAKTQTPKEILGTEASAELRDRLIAELGSLAAGDDAALWAHRSLTEKNKLTAADALQVEEAFEARVTGLAVPQRRRQPEAQPERSPTKSSKAPKKRVRHQGDRQERSDAAGAAAAFVTAITSSLSRLILV